MFTTRPELAGTFGMVGSTHWLASQSAMAVLEEGGNAVDAAVAGAFVLHVVEPHLNGPGGDLPLILKTADAEPVVLCGQGPAPAGATVGHYRGEGLTTVPGTGLLAAAVPGAVPAWLTLLRDHGTRAPADVLRFAIGYAEHGHPVLERVAATIDRMARFFDDHWPTSYAAWLPGGTPPTAGQLVTNPVLARTYRRLAEAGSGTREQRCDAALAAWSEGFVAEAVGAFVRTPVHDTSGAAHAGVLTAQDLAGYRPAYEPTASVSWRGRTVHKPGAWSQGPVLLQQLALLDPLLPDHLDDWTADAVHAAAEVARLAFADRDAHYGDVDDAVDLVVDLLDPAYLDARRALVGATASGELRPGTPGGREPVLSPSVRATSLAGDGMAGTGEPTRGDTCHLDVVDRWGTVVSATPSGGWLQSSPTIPDLGFCLGTRLQMTWLEDGLPSTLTPGRRPRTTLSPSLAVGDDGVVTAFGTPGGDQQDQWQLVFWLAHTVLGRDLQAAIDAPSWHVTSMVSSFDPRVWQPRGLEVEGRLDAGIVDSLRDRGHDVLVGGDWSLGRMSAVSRDPSTGILKAAANPRGMQGYAVGR